MNKILKQLTMRERWKMDIESYKNGANIKVSIPQCETCNYFIKGNAFHCKKYQNIKKPEYVLFPTKECQYYFNNELQLEILSEMENKFYGGLFGFCIGDILGLPVEFSSRQEREKDPVKELRAYGTYHQPFGTWSDDTSLILCFIDAVINGFSLDKIANNFILFYKEAYFTPHGEVFDIGNTTKDAIERMIHNVALNDCGGKKESDNGNGSLMRILPMAFWGINMRREILIDLIESISSLTHAHKRSRFACIFYVVYAMHLIQGYGKMDAYEETREYINETCMESYADELINFQNILNKKCIIYPRKQIRSSGYVIDTLEAVMWSFCNEDSYEKTVLSSINLGGDTDTIAALTGGLAGIYYGYNNIPDLWIQNICKKKELQQMFSNFYQIIKTNNDKF